jgi:hypothetical protein
MARPFRSIKSQFKSLFSKPLKDTVTDPRTKNMYAFFLDHYRDDTGDDSELSAKVLADFIKTIRIMLTADKTRAKLVPDPSKEPFLTYVKLENAQKAGEPYDQELKGSISSVLSFLMRATSVHDEATETVTMDIEKYYPGQWEAMTPEERAEEIVENLAAVLKGAGEIVRELSTQMGERGVQHIVAQSLADPDWDATKDWRRVEPEGYGADDKGILGPLTYKLWDKEVLDDKIAALQYAARGLKSNIGQELFPSLVHHLLMEGTIEAVLVPGLNHIQLHPVGGTTKQGAVN